MAEVHIRRNRNRKKRAVLNLMAAVSVPAAAAVCFSFVLYSVHVRKFSPAGAAAVLITVLLCVFCFSACRKKSMILKSGIDGEDQAASVLRALPDSYHILLNPVFHIRGREAELDALVIGPNGVFIVETKNHSGVISGNVRDEFWLQKKRTETKRMKNPLMQSERQIRLIRQLLEDLKKACPVYGCVYFANPNAEIRVEDERIFTDGTSVCRAICSKKPSDVRCGPEKLARQILKKCV